MDRVGIFCFAMGHQRPLPTIYCSVCSAASCVLRASSVPFLIQGELIYVTSLRVVIYYVPSKYIFWRSSTRSYVIFL